MKYQTMRFAAPALFALLLAVAPACGASPASTVTSATAITVTSVQSQTKTLSATVTATATTTATTTATATVTSLATVTTTATVTATATVMALPPATTIPALTATGSYLTKAGTVEKDISYSTVDVTALTFDVYYPSKPTWPVPAVVYLHGGAWVGGDKSDASASPEVIDLVSKGFMVVSVNYGLAPTYTILQQAQNAKCAVRFLRSNAAYFGLNPAKVGAIGSSAGGHLVSLLGTAGKGAGMDGVGGCNDQSSSVQAVVDMCGPVDLNSLLGIYASVVQTLCGTDPANLSPQTYISADDPPFLILQGDKDALVPVAQSQTFYQKLTAGGVKVTLVVVQNADHSFNASGGDLSPSRTAITGMVSAFFGTQLK